MRDKHFNLENQLNINHFEKLSAMFQEHRNPDGTTGFNLEKFYEVFGKLFGNGSVSKQHMTMLFMKIDANSDGSMEWDEFSTYMLKASNQMPSTQHVIEEKDCKTYSTPHKDMIVYLDFFAKERKYVSVSREGVMCVWSQAIKLLRTFNARDFLGTDGWVLSAKLMHECSRLILVTDHRQLCWFDLFSIKPRLISVISQLENNPLCLAITCDYDENTDMIIYGDDGGFVNVLTLKRKVLLDNVGDFVERLLPATLMKNDSMEKHKMFLYRRKVHSQWVLKVQYYLEMNSFVSCSLDTERSLVMGDLERKTLRCISIPNGIETFEFCRRPSYLITGGRDRIIRLWNPYVLSKPTASLIGHSDRIVKIAVGNDDGLIFSLSEDKIIKVWNARSLTCCNTLFDKIAHRPENRILTMFYDHHNKALLTAATKLTVWPLYVSQKKNSHSHDSPVVKALYNTNFNQVVSGCESGTITLWDPPSGEDIFSLHKPHGPYGITAMCFDKSGRRLITASRDRDINMWNFNNGHILGHMRKLTANETTDVIFIEMGSSQYVIASGWDRKITMFLVDTGEFISDPIRVIDGAGTAKITGHTADITSIAFGEPNLLASSSTDGAIVIWNLETGGIKAVLREPNLELRNEQERVVENLLFLNCAEALAGGANALFSCHADGYIRVWNVIEGKMIKEHDFQLIPDEGLITITADHEGKRLVIGGSSGHIRIVSIAHLLSNQQDSQNESLLQEYCFRAHLTGVTSVLFVQDHEMILTGGLDGQVRLWTFNGVHIGTFGDPVWGYLDETQRKLPKEIQSELKLDEAIRSTEVKQKDKMNKKIIHSWKDASGEKGIKSGLPELKTTEKTLAVKSYIGMLFKNHMIANRNMTDWKINPDTISIKNAKKIFSYDYKEGKEKNKESLAVDFSSIYHSLKLQGLADVSPTNDKSKLLQNHGALVDATSDRKELPPTT